MKYLISIFIAIYSLTGFTSTTSVQPQSISLVKVIESETYFNEINNKLKLELELYFQNDLVHLPYVPTFMEKQIIISHITEFLNNISTYEEILENELDYIENGFTIEVDVMKLYFNVYTIQNFSQLFNRGDFVSFIQENKSNQSIQHLISVVKKLEKKPFFNISKWNKVIEDLHLKYQDENLIQTLESQIFKNLTLFKNHIRKNKLSGKISEHYGFIYDLKTILLYTVSFFSLPRKHDITKTQIDEIEDLLFPGDIALIKHRYKLTNVAIEGDWSHSILYVGSPEKTFPIMDNDQEIATYISNRCLEENLECKKFSEYLELKFPVAFKKYTSKDKYKGSEVSYQSLESKRQGIQFYNIYDSLQKDQLIVFRPKLSQLEKAKSLLKAFEFYGRPYDYKFDLRTSNKMICTELIFRSYEADLSYKKMGINFQYSSRKMTPLLLPQDIMDTYTNEIDLRNPQLELVLLLGNK